MRHVCSLTPVILRSPLPSGTWWRQVLRAGFAVLLALVTAESALAQINVTAAWDPNTDGRTAGYVVQVGVTAGNPMHTVDVGQATSVILPLSPGAVYYVSVRAYNNSRQMGPATEEIVDLANSPGAPENFRASVSGVVASLAWGSPDTGGIATRYLLSVGTASGASNLLSEYPVGNVNGVSGALPPGTYYARLQAGNMVGIGPQAPEVQFTVGNAGAPPAAPSGLAAAWSGAAVTLSWSAVGGATSYVLEAGSSPGATNIGVFDVGGATAFSAAVPAGTFYVRVRARNAVGTSAPSNEVVLRSGAPVPGAPRNLTSSVSGGNVTLRWSAPTSGGAPTSYVVEAGSAPGQANLGAFNAGNVTSFTVPVPPGTYYVRIRAANATGTGNASNEVTVRR